MADLQQRNAPWKNIPVGLRRETHRFRKIGRVALLGIGLLGCASPHPPFAEPTADLDVGDTQWLADFDKPSETILRGIDPPQHSDTWLVGSEALYSVRIEGRGPVLTRFVHFKLASPPLNGFKIVRINPSTPADNARKVFDIHDPGERPGELPVKRWIFQASMEIKGQSQEASKEYTIDSDSIAVRLGLYDEAGRRMESHYALLPEAHLRQGLAQYAEWAVGLDPAPSVVPTPEQLAWFFKSQAALFSFGAVVNASPVALPLMKHILPRSTLLGIWLFGKPKIDFELGRPTPETRKLPALARNRKGWQLPLTISMNNDPTLQCRLTVTAPDSPFDLCAGVVAFEGVLIEHPERRFQMHLIAARRPGAQTAATNRE